MNWAARKCCPSASCWIARCNTPAATASYLRLPFWAAKLQAIATSPLPNASAPSRSIRSACCSATTSSARRRIDDGRTLAGLGIPHPHSVASIVPAYLERFKPKGQYASYRG